jgi:hypothetical protein
MSHLKRRDSVSEQFWTQVLDVVKYALGGLGIILFFQGWPRFYKKCQCDKCQNFKKEEED